MLCFLLSQFPTAFPTFQTLPFPTMKYYMYLNDVISDEEHDDSAYFGPRSFGEKWQPKTDIRTTRHDDRYHAEFDIPDNVDKCYIVYHYHDNYFDGLPTKIFTNRKEAEEKFMKDIQYDCLVSIDEADSYIKDHPPCADIDKYIVIVENFGKVKTSTFYEVEGLYCNYPDKGSRTYLHTLVRGEDYF